MRARDRLIQRRIVSVFASRGRGLFFVGISTGLSVCVLLALPANFPGADRHVLTVQELGKGEQRP